MKYIIIVIIVLFLIFSQKIIIYLKKSEKLEIKLKIGQIFHLKTNNKMLIDFSNRISNYDLTLFFSNNKDNNDEFTKKVLKELTIEKLTVIQKNNIFNTVWNIGIPFTMYMFNIYIDNYIKEKFKKVKDTYYSVEYDTLGSVKLHFDLTLSIRVYKLVYILISYLIFKRKKKAYGKQN